jgi:hypothetical protein
MNIPLTKAIYEENRETVLSWSAWLAEEVAAVSFTPFTL